MDLAEAKALVLADLRWQDPDRFKGWADEAVLGSLVEDGVDEAEVSIWDVQFVGRATLNAYLMVVRQG